MPPNIKDIKVLQELQCTKKENIHVGGRLAGKIETQKAMKQASVQASDEE